MRANYLVVGFLFCVSGVAWAGDKEVLRDACGAIKLAVKRNQCFDAIENLSTKQEPPPLVVLQEPEKQSEEPVQLNTRAMIECETFEFSELNSLSASQLIALSCSYDQGFSNHTSSAQIAKNDRTRGPGMQAALIRTYVGKAEKCMNAGEKVSDLLFRKYPKQKKDCSKIPGFKPRGGDSWDGLINPTQ